MRTVRRAGKSYHWCDNYREGALQGCEDPSVLSWAEKSVSAADTTALGPNTLGTASGRMSIAHRAGEVVKP